MRVALVLVGIGFACSVVGDAEARARGGGAFKGGRGSYSAPQAKTPQAKTPQARSGPSVGVGVGVVVPVGTSRPTRGATRPQGPYLLPLPPRPPEDGDTEAPKIYSASADAASTNTEARRPWCHDGEVVGRGAGFCEVTLAAERRGAPALLAFGN